MIILIVLIAIRFFAQSLSAFWADGWINVIIFLVIAGAYLAAFIGVMQKAKWGVIIVAVIAAIDLAAAIFVGGASGFGAAFLDVLLLVLAYLELRSIQQGDGKKPLRRKPRKRK